MWTSHRSISSTVETIPPSPAIGGPNTPRTKPPVSVGRCNDALRHAAHHHPNCPAEMVALFADDISTREWEPPLTLGQAFGIKATNHVRHKLTDYDRLLRIPGLTRDEARLIVGFEVRATLAGWQPKHVTSQYRDATS